MRRILIVGAGQSGLQLAFGLERHGYDVTVMSARTAEQIEHGNIMSSQFMFESTIKFERDLGIYFWEGKAPRTPLTRFMVGADGSAPVVDWTSPLKYPGADVDQRVKMSRWLRLFEERGGRLIIGSITPADLDRLASEYDLVIVAAGKDGLAGMFDRNSSRSPYTTPQRMLSVIYVNGYQPDPAAPGDHTVEFHMLPGKGEMIVMPALTLSGPCHILFFEAIPGGPLDVFGDVQSPEEHLDLFVRMLKQHVPWSSKQYTRLELTDPGASLKGGFAPVVRHPVATLPGGAHVLGMGDVVVANDPITGQGSNMAAKCAAVYLDAIIEHGNQPFDDAFMTSAFETFWTLHGRATTEWTNTMLQPPPPFMLDLLGAASQYKAIANRYTEAFDDPNDFQEWFLDGDKAAAYLAEVVGAAAGPGR